MTSHQDERGGRQCGWADRAGRYRQSAGHLVAELRSSDLWLILDGWEEKLGTGYRKCSLQPGALLNA